MAKRQSIKRYFEQIMEEGIHNSRWFRTAPPELQKTAKIKMLGVEERTYSSMIHSGKRPALVAECECGGETATFTLLIDNTGNVEMAKDLTY